VDLAPKHKSASVQVSAPQFYKREALINERRDEIEYLKDQLKHSKDVVFTPELFRDIETISVISAQLGLSFDAGLKQQAGSYTELSNLQHQLSVLKLRDQLAQLERDIELRKAMYAEQTNPTSSSPSSSPVAASEPVDTEPALPDFTKLDALVTKLTARLDAESKGPRPTTAASSPIDVLRDRQAYRRYIQAAINEVSLDDTHDQDGNSLFRMQFNTTVLPGDESVDKSLGVLRMKITPPKFSKASDEVKSLYLEWLDHITLRLNEINNNVGPAIDPMLLAMSRTNEIFNIVWLFIDKPTEESSDPESSDPKSSDPKSSDPKSSDPKSSDPKSSKQSCPTLYSSSIPTDEERKNCFFIPIAMPLVPGLSEADKVAPVASPGASDAAEKAANKGGESKAPVSNENHPPDAAKLKIDPDKVSSAGATTTTVNAANNGNSSDTATVKIDPDNLLFRNREFIYRAPSSVPQPQINEDAKNKNFCRKSELESKGVMLLPFVNRLQIMAADVIANREDLESDIKTDLIYRLTSLVNGQKEEAKTLLEKCKSNIDTAYTSKDLSSKDLSKEFIVPEKFLNSLLSKIVKKGDAIGNEKDVYVASGKSSAYAVTPSELAQRISSVARAGNAVQIAASLSALLPVQGFGGNSALGYSRSAIGKVDAMERVPLVVGYADANNGFGWVLGPKVIFDSQNRALELEHNLAPYSLTADVVMPGWWPYFELEYQSEWGPDWQKKQFSDFYSDRDVVNPAKTESVKVVRRHSRADLDGITMLALKQLGTPKAEIATITRVDPKTVSGCAGKVTLLIRGTNIWRTETVYLAGFISESIKVLPDMAGISVTFDMSELPRQPSSAKEKTKQTKLSLLTPYGTISTDITIDGSRLDEKNGCGKEWFAKTPPAADKSEPIISSVLPETLYACDATQRILVQGKNLKKKKIKAVYLGTIKVETENYNNLNKIGSDLEVRIEKTIANIGGSQGTLPLIITTNKGTVSQDLKIERNGSCVAAQKEDQPALFPLPAGRLDICARKATLLLTDNDIARIDRATLTLKKPKEATIQAQSVKIVKEQGMAEIRFVGLLTQGATDSTMVDDTVDIHLFHGDKLITKNPISVEAVCGRSNNDYL